jgi:hypothetical protein
MWWSSYQDLQEDEPLKRHTVEAGRGINGCEMKEECGWGLTKHKYLRQQSPGFLRTLIALFIGKRR